MKTIMMMIAVLATSVAMASDKGDKVQEARQLFKSLTPMQALASKKLDKRTWNIHVPGTSTWTNPGNLCISNGTFNTINPISSCVLWGVNLKESEFGKNVVYFKSMYKADNKADGSNGKGSAFCAEKSYKDVSVPLVQQVEGCVLWGVDRKDDSPRYFKSKGQASNYADDSSNAKGSEYCAQEGMVTVRQPTQFSVDFFRKTSGSNKWEDKVGNHTYPIQSCDGDLLPPVIAM